MSDSRTPIGAEARGRVRAWKRAALARYRRIEAVLASDAFQKSRPGLHAQTRQRPATSAAEGEANARRGAF
jgi:hypothetical protein